MTKLIPILAIIALALSLTLSHDAHAQSNEPAKPAGLTATMSGSSVVLTWTDPGTDADVTGYEIYRSFHIDSLVTLRILKDKVTTYTDKLPSQGQINVYAIKAVNANGLSPRSDSVSIAPPAKPDRLTATVAMSGVTLNWRQPEMQDWVSMGDNTITGYRILRGTSPDNLAEIEDDTESATTSYEDTTTRPTGGVYYAAQAITAVGMSLPSEPLAVETPDPVDLYDGNDLTLASNWRLGNSKYTVTVGSDEVQEPFRTGPSTRGYTIERLLIDVVSVANNPRLSINIAADQDNAPGDTVHTLTGPATLATGLNTFTAPTAARLSPDTRYWLVFRAATGSAELQLANLGGRDDRAAPGFRLFQQNALHHHSSPIRLRMIGQDRNDLPADDTTTGRLHVGQTTHSTIDGHQDRDWFKVWLEAGKMYRFDDVAHRRNRATVLAVYDPDGDRQPAFKIHHDLPNPMRRVYFTATDTGMHHVAVGVLEHAYATADAPDGERNHASYGIRVMLGDPETADTNTTVGLPGDNIYQGDFFTPHNGNTDTDLIRVQMDSDYDYQFILLSDPMVNISISRILDGLGNPVSDFSPVTGSRQPTFNTNPYTGESSFGGYRIHENNHSHWIETIYSPAHSGPYYIEVTAGPSTYTVGRQLDADGQPLPGATDTVVERDFHGADYTLRMWDSGQNTIGEEADSDTSAPSAFVSTRLQPDGRHAEAYIHHAGDTDWFTLWAQQGQEYVFIFEQGPTDASIAEIIELPWKQLNFFEDRHAAIQETTGVTGCSLYTFRARRDGIHFVTVTGHALGRYALSANAVRSEPDFRYDGQVGNGNCTSGGYITPGQSVSDEVTAGGVESVFMHLEAGTTYRVVLDIINHTTGSLRHPDGTSYDLSTIRPHGAHTWTITPTVPGVYAVLAYGTHRRGWDYRVELRLATPPPPQDLPTVRIDNPGTDHIVINEGDSFDILFSMDRTLSHALDVNILIENNAVDVASSYPQFQGGHRQTITIPAYSRRKTITIQSINDDITTKTAALDISIEPSPDYLVASDSGVDAYVNDGTYVDELDALGVPTGTTVFDPAADTVAIGWAGCTGTAAITVPENIGTIELPVTMTTGRVAYAHSWGIETTDLTASRLNDFILRRNPHFPPLATQAFATIDILDKPQLEDTETFIVNLWNLGRSVHQFTTGCRQLNITIEDDDDAQTSIYAENDTVTEGADITVTVQTNQGPFGECNITSPVYAEVTPSGDTAGLADPAAQTIRIPVCYDAGDLTFATADDATATADRSVTFEVTRLGTAMDFGTTDDRILLPLDTVTVTIVDDDNTSGQQAEPETPTDDTPPLLQSTAVDGSSLVLTYDEDLDLTSSPSTSLFAVNVNGTSSRPMGTAIGGSTVTLLLFAGVEHGDTVTVSYTAPTGPAEAGIQDTSGNAAVSFANQAVSNDTAPAEEPQQREPGTPMNLRAAPEGSGELSVSWTAPADGPTPSGYTVQWKASSDDWSDANAVSAAQVTTDSHLITGLSNGTAYTVRVSATKDNATGDPTADITATPRDTTPPALSGASVNGATLTLSFNEDLDTAHTPDASAFVVTVAGNDRRVDTATASGSTVTLTLVTAAFNGEATTVSYTAPTSDAIQNAAGNAAASFSNQAVTDDTPAASQLTATTSNLPASHDGNTFTFELRLSEEPRGGFSYKTMRDHAFTVTNGDVTKARRLNRPSNSGWEIHVTPDGDGEVTVTLPATTDCTAQGSVCTQDRRPLSQRLQVTVPGPGG